jgi:VanZ family protein
MLLFQKGFHVFLFAVLGGLLVSASSRLPALYRALYRAILWSFVIGALSEALQLLFAGRGPSFADVLLNGVSGTAGGWIWLRVLLGRQKTAPRAVT